MEKKHLWLVAAFFAGVILADKVRAAPVIGPKIPTV
jgi:hypothetical protein